MNKLLLSASALVLGLTIANQASADCNGLYLAARGGVVKHDLEKPKSGINANDNNFDKKRFMGSVAVGYRYNYFRGELEYVWRDKIKNSDSVTDIIGSTSTLTQKFNTYSYMLNGYIDFAPYHWITPYVGAGIGYTKYKFKDQVVTDGVSEKTSLSKTNFTWSVGGGLSIKVTNRFNVDAGYRYYDMNKFKYTNGYKRDLTAQEVYGGIRYVF